MAKKLNDTHGKLYEAIKKYPNQTTLFYHNKVKVTYSLAQNYVTHLLKVGLVEVSGRKGRLRKYVVTGADFNAVKAEFVKKHKKKKKREIPADIPDPLLEQAKTFDLTDDQWHYIKANPSLSRKEISKSLGIPRTVLLAAITRRKDRERGGKR